MNIIERLNAIITNGEMQLCWRIAAIPIVVQETMSMVLLGGGRQIF